MRSPRHFSRIAGATAAAVALGLVFSAGTARADNPPAPKTTFDMVVNPVDGTTNVPSDGESVPNVDSVKSTIRAYYNATNGVANKSSSRYITQVHAIENQLLASLPASHALNAAVVFDVDDTLLWNYDFEDSATNFNFDPTLNTTWVTQHLFVAVPGMPQLVRTIQARGYAIYGITGRPSSQSADTVTNLTQQGFTTNGTPAGTPLFTASNLFTKGTVDTSTTPATIPTQPWVDCSADGVNTACSTVEYKALTRKHLEDPAGANLDVVMNVGDQWSDLQGGFADNWTKIPNPTYFLASPDLTTAPASDANMVPPTSYVMQADGSSGYSETTGDDIPNIDPVRKFVRAYYNADSTGTANKVTSPYITQLTSLESTWTTQETSNCTSRSQAYNAALATQNAAKAVVAADAAKVAKDKKAVAKAKKELAQAKTKKDRQAAQKKLDKATKALKKGKAALRTAKAHLAAVVLPAQPAVVFDADDTTLWNYDLEDGVMKFVYNPTTANTWVTGHLFPAVPGMVSVVKAAKAAGCTVFGITGRPASQQADTIANLSEKGYVDSSNQPLFTSTHYFTKDTANQPWVDCGSDGVCSTIEYKSGTRQHIETLGYDIVGNFGDQYSDLLGGFADHIYKVPNPTYYLP